MSCPAWVCTSEAYLFCCGPMCEMWSILSLMPVSLVKRWPISASFLSEFGAKLFQQRYEISRCWPRAGGMRVARIPARPPPVVARKRRRLKDSMTPPWLRECREGAAAVKARRRKAISRRSYHPGRAVRSGVATLLRRRPHARRVHGPAAVGRVDRRQRRGVDLVLGEPALPVPRDERLAPRRQGDEAVGDPDGVGSRGPDGGDRGNRSAAHRVDFVHGPRRHAGAADLEHEERPREQRPGATEVTHPSPPSSCSARAAPSCRT